MKAPQGKTEKKRKPDGQIVPTPLQARVLSYRGRCNLIDLGGRGSGKSFCMLLSLIFHCQDPESRPLVLRESWAGLQEISSEIYRLGVLAFGKRTTRNRQSGQVTMGNGCVVSLSNLGDETSYGKLQGRSFTGLFADEVGNYPPGGFKFLKLTMSNLRTSPDKKVIVHLCGNPHGRSHQRILREFVNGHQPWIPWRDETSGELWVYTTSTYLDNEHLDQEAYRRKLLAATAGDESLASAWLEGDWSVLGGSMFDTFRSADHVLRTPPPIIARRYRLLIACDWGSASPSVALLLGVLREPCGRYRVGDTFVLDEIDTSIPGDLSAGTGLSISSWAEEIKILAQRNHLPRVPEVVSDDARGLFNDSVVKEMQACGLNARKPYRKDRQGGWQLIRNLLQSAVDLDSRPGLWISEKCVHLLQTLPEAPRGQLRREDLDPRWDEDHWLDALSYGLLELYGQPSIRGGTTTGMI